MGVSRQPSPAFPDCDFGSNCSLKKESDIRDAFKRLSADYGFRGFMVVTLPSRVISGLAKSVMMTDWPSDFFKHYDSAGLMTVSPVFARLRRSTVPFTFDTDRSVSDRFGTQLKDAPLTERHARVASALFSKMRLPRGVYIPVHDVSGRRGAVAFAGERPVIDRDEMNVLTFVAGHLFNCLSEIRSAVRRSPGSLSRREIECLRLAASGRTTVEMARILSLSEYTVNHYLGRATRKLDSVNRVQTIAKAIRAGLIM